RERQRLYTSSRLRNDFFVPDPRQVRPAIRGTGNRRSIRLWLNPRSRRSLPRRILTKNKDCDQDDKHRRDCAATVVLSHTEPPFSPEGFYFKLLATRSTA